MSANEPFSLESTRAAIRGRLGPGEDLDTVMDLVVHLARRRADVLGRPPSQDDLEFTLAAFCWWPGKTPPPPNVTQSLVRVRSELLAYRRPSSLRGDVRERRARLANYLAEAVVPDETLRLSFGELERAQQRGIDYLDTTTLRGPPSGEQDSSAG